MAAERLEVGVFELFDGPLDAARVEAAVAHAGAGAILVFHGVTRNTFGGRTVLRLDYEAYAGMAEAEMAAIGDQVTAQWPGARVAMLHRTGTVPVGEASIIIAVSAPHRGECYEASRFAIDALKARVPIWKKEIYEDGSEWRENAESGQGVLDGAATRNQP